MKRILILFTVLVFLISACIPKDMMTNTPLPQEPLAVKASLTPFQPAASPAETAPSTPVGGTAVPSFDPEAQLRGMTLEQKIGQVMIIGFDGTTVSLELRELIEKYHVGGVILFARNVESPRQVASLTRSLQEIALASGPPGLFIAIDQEGGRVARLTEATGFTEFPGAMALGATGDPDLARQVAQAIAREMKAVGLNIDFAPDLDVNNNYKNPVIGIRSFSSDPAEVAKYGVQFIEGLQGEGVLAFGKHFPGHGDTGVDSHLALPVVPHDRSRLDAVEFVPFRAAIAAGAAGIMSAHVAFPAIETVIPDLPATLSAQVLTGLLREEMGFQGLTVTDSLEMGALAQSGFPVSRAAAMALQAGSDLLLFNRDHSLHRQAIQLISEWIREGKIPQSRLDEAVLRVYRTKAAYQLIRPALADLNAVNGLVGTGAAHSLALEVARRSVTLVQDKAGLVPLSKTARLLVLETSGARGLGKALGATTIDVKDQPSSSDIEAWVRSVQGQTVIIGTTDAINNPGQANLVKALIKAGIPTIVVATRGPYDLLAFCGAPAYLATYGANPPALAAAADVLTGAFKPQGRLPVDLPEGNVP